MNADTEQPLYFAFDPADGFDTYQTAERAKLEADQAFARYKSEAPDGWDEGVDRVCWGLVLGQVEVTKETERPPDEEIDEDGYDADGVKWQDFSCMQERELVEQVNPYTQHVAELEARLRVVKGARATLEQSNGELRAELAKARPWALFYRDRKTLEQIAEELGGNVHGFSPWLFAPLTRVALETQAGFSSQLTKAREQVDSLRQQVADLTSALSAEKAGREKAEREKGEAVVILKNFVKRFDDFEEATRDGEENRRRDAIDWLYAIRDTARQAIQTGGKA